MNPQGAAAPADGAAQAAPGPLPQAAGPHPAPATGSPQAAPRPPPPRPNFFRPMRPMPPRRERKSWTLPPAPGPSLRQRVEQREREEGLRCFDTSCGIGPSDEFPLLSPSSRKHVSIHPHHDHDRSISGAVCAHTFHPACLVSAERVAGWGDEGKSKTEPLVEVSCPVCRAVGCVTREEWEEGVSAL
ncbi:hypothetical protein HYDPIDRAFT_90429 [Hydnomerulius pinastri MD-312]|uniref:Uncharacterized protein n=1 Tax=Hydnomerulius pinastri MD-312 TaxID=994086 RepID=A0A0C9WFZ2_9AGAM|nr:hypothetical protein HYDPIDRAFT_90429 [Hydnomerulius pinastri MD-312]